MKERLTSGVYFKPKEGENRIRVVSQPLEVWKAFNQATKKASVYVTEEGAKGDKNAKPRFLLYILNRGLGNTLQQAEFGAQIMTQFLDLATMSESGFSDLPPYDMILTKTGSGMETEYKLHASRQNTELTAEEIKLVESAKPILDLLREDESVVDAKSLEGEINDEALNKIFGT